MIFKNPMGKFLENSTRRLNKVSTSLQPCCDALLEVDREVFVLLWGGERTACDVLVSGKGISKHYRLRQHMIVDHF